MALDHFMERIWDGDIVPALTDYIRIPNKSPMFDPDWQSHGHMDKAVALFEGWARAKLAKLPGASLEVVQVAGRTPLIFIEVPGKAPGTVLLYGHLDKQPEMKGWDEGMGPWTPVLKDNGFMAAAAPMTVMRCSRHSPPCLRSPRAARRMRAASSPSRLARNPARPICLSISIIWRGASARPIWWCASIRDAAITISFG